MNQNQWSQPTTDNQAARRAGGRRAHNARRQMVQIARRRKVKRLAIEGLTKAEIARRLGVHRCTIGRDIEADSLLALTVDLVETHRDLSDPAWLKEQAAKLKQGYLNKYQP